MTEALLTDEQVATLPLEERIAIALDEAGIDESDVETVLGVVLPMLAADLRAFAKDVEWKHRSMTFYRTGEATRELHPVGQDVRDYADRLSAPETAGTDR